MPIRVGFETTVYTKYYIARILKCVYTALHPEVNEIVMFINISSTQTPSNTQLNGDYYQIYSIIINKGTLLKKVVSL